MKKLGFTLLFLIISLFVVGCSANTEDEGADVEDTEERTDKEATENEGEPVELMVSAAVSLTDALYDIQEAYEKENNVKLTFNLAGSGTLAQQIEQGAPADVFISANQDWMDTLEDKDLITDETREEVTGNSIVLITQEDSDIEYNSFEDISADDVDQIAIGNPESVPAGNYTKQTLKSIELWDDLEDEVILAKDVRQVLTYVESGNASIGFVYESDALTSDKVKILAKSDPEWHDPIIYPGAVVADTKHEEAATDFFNYMLSDEAQSILEKYGFK